jgi:hypothetical protein
MTTDLIEETTEPLPNGSPLPDHPSSTTALRIVEYGDVYDEADGRPLKAGRLHESAIRMLMDGNVGGLGHLYFYAIRNRKIYHTRKLVTIDCKCTPV